MWDQHRRGLYFSTPSHRSVISYQGKKWDGSEEEYEFFNDGSVEIAARSCLEREGLDQYHFEKPFKL
jgi:hypothetical protein